MEKLGDKGSATLETAMVLPMILAVILLLMCFLIHLYDKNVIAVATCQGAMQLYYEQGNSNSAIKKSCIAKAEEVISGNLVGTEKPKVTVEVGRFKVKVKAEAESKFLPFQLFGFHFKELLPELVAEWEITRFSQTEFIRNVRKAKLIYEWGKGFVDSEEGGKDDTGRIQAGIGSKLFDSQGGQ